MSEIVNQVLVPVRIVADDRERAGGILAELKARDDVILQVRRLSVGDFLVDGDFVVERKTMGDFARSVVDARLFRQASALARERRRGVLILEGAAPAGEISRVSREAMQGAVITATVFFGLALLRSRDPAESARLLVYLARQACRYARGGVTRPGYRPKGKRARQLYLLQGLPGVGPGRASSLLERFGSVQAAFAATAAELVDVPGIGENSAARIRWALE